MLRRIAITLAAAATAGLVAATPAVADGGWEAGKAGAGYQAIEAHRGHAEYTNLGGPYGITYAEESRHDFAAERGYLYAEYLHGH
ncbi:hypothetical protein ACIOD0_21085 [Kitasatospora albolonga]|uniref:Uncharacterized protein n=1 Tax=Kitasatospora albolonga TaxID=68173 RepID=A0ABC8BLR4_9ACTN|nr:hypothetical protein B7C62_00045 [Kitasatospora albolonga]